MKDFTPLSLLRVSPGSQGKDVSQSAGRNVPVRRAGYKTLSCTYHASSRDNGSLRHADDFMDETRLLEFDLLPTTTFGLRSASSFHIDIARTLQTSSNLFAESSARASGLRTLQRSCEGHGRYKTHRLLQLSPQPQACKQILAGKQRNPVMIYVNWLGCFNAADLLLCWWTVPWLKKGEAKVSV